MYGALHWRRMTAAGAVASILVGNAVLLWALSRPAPLGGLLPVAYLFAATAALVAVSGLSRPPRAAVIERALGPR